MANASAESVGTTVGAVNTDACAATVDYVTNHGHKVGGTIIPLVLVFLHHLIINSTIFV